MNTDNSSFGSRLGSALGNSFVKRLEENKVRISLAPIDNQIGELKYKIALKQTWLRSWIIPLGVTVVGWFAYRAFRKG